MDTNVTITTTMPLADAQRLLTSLQNQVKNWDTMKANQLADLNARITTLQAAIAAATPSA